MVTEITLRPVLICLTSDHEFTNLEHGATNQEVIDVPRELEVFVVQEIETHLGPNNTCILFSLINLQVSRL